MLEKTVRDVFNEFTEEQKKVVYFLIGKASNKNFVETMQKELDQEIDKWKKATGCNTPEEASKKLNDYANRLDSVKESASYAIRHLDNIVFRDDKRKDWSDK